MFTPGCGVASITHPPSEQAQFDRLGAARPGGGSSRVREKGRVCSVAPCGVTKQFQAREGRPVGRAGVHRARTVTASMVKRRAGRRAQHQPRGSLLGCRKKRHCDASAPPPGYRNGKKISTPSTTASAPVGFRDNNGNSWFRVPDGHLSALPRETSIGEFIFVAFDWLDEAAAKSPWEPPPFCGVC